MAETGMTRTENDTAQPASPGSPSGLGLAWARLVDGLAALGTAMIAVLMAMICADIFARNVMGASLPLISELSALTLVMIVFLQLGTAVRHARLAQIELFMNWLSTASPRAHTALTAVWNLAGAAACGAIAWSTYGILAKDFSHSVFIGVTGVLTMPVWPFRALILIGASVAALQFLFLAVGNVRLAAQQPRQPQ